MAINQKKVSVTPKRASESHRPQFEVTYNGVVKGTWFPKYGNLYAYRCREGVRLFRRFERNGQSKFDYDLIFADFANDEHGEAVVKASDLEAKTHWLLRERII